MELFAAKYEMDYRALNERLLTKEQRLPELAHFSAPLVGGGCC